MIYRDNSWLEEEFTNMVLDSLEKLESSNLVVSIESTEKGIRVKSLSGEPVNIEIKGEKGEKGEKGDPGEKGEPGTNGTNGTNGRDGLDGTNGIDGTNGTNGTNGRDGTDGTNGRDGTNGKDGTNGTDGVDGEKGEAGVGIVDVQVDRQNTLIIKTSDGKVYRHRIRLRAGGTVVVGSTPTDPVDPPEPPPPFTYTNADPMPKALGGFPAGTTFDNVSLQDMWTRLLYPQDPPVFTSFDIVGLDNLVDLGYIISGDQTVTWAFNEEYLIQDSSLSLTFYPTDTVYFENASKVSPATINVTPNIVINEPGNLTFRIRAKANDGHVIQKDFDLGYRGRVYYGESSLTALYSSELVTDLRASELTEEVNGIYEFEPGDYKYICYPAFFGARTKFIDADTNFAIAMQQVNDVNVTLSTGLTVPYHVYRTYNTLGGSIRIEVVS